MSVTATKCETETNNEKISPKNETLKVLPSKNVNCNETENTN